MPHSKKQHNVLFYVTIHHIFHKKPASVHVTHSAHPKRNTLYSHIQAKIDTGLPRTNSINRIEPDTHQLEPLRPVNWCVLKHEIEHDLHIRAHTKRMQFNSGILYATQLTTLGNLVRSKVKSHLSSATGSGDERYKIVVHLTIFPTTAAGLHVASRCLWNTHTDNSITIKNARCRLRYSYYCFSLLYRSWNDINLKFSFYISKF